MSGGAVTDEVITDALCSELLLRDDGSYVALWWNWFTCVQHLPAGSSVEGAFLARNSRDYREWEVEQDKMRVIGYCKSRPSCSALEVVGDGHVHIRHPHPDVRLLPRWAKKLKVVENMSRHSPYLSGRGLLHEYRKTERSVGSHDIQGPSVASTYCFPQTHAGELKKTCNDLRKMNTMNSRLKSAACGQYVTEVWSIIIAKVQALSDVIIVPHPEVCLQSDVNLMRKLHEYVSWCRQIREIDQELEHFCNEMKRYVETCESHYGVSDLNDPLTASADIHSNYRVVDLAKALLASLINDMTCFRKLCDLVSLYLIEPTDLNVQQMLSHIIKHAHAVDDDVPMVQCINKICELLSSLSCDIERGIEIVEMYYSHLLYKITSTDNVPVLEALYWPHQAQSFVDRQRHWPPEEIVHQIVSQGFHLVSKPRPAIPRFVSDYDWRISFALSEQILARARSWKQRKTYYLFKIFYYKYLKRIEFNGESLRSYACKSVMLWVCEEQESAWWQENTTTHIVMHLLDYLMKCLQRRHLPYYFIDSVNLFDAWQYPQVVVDECQSMLRKILSDPFKYLVCNTDILMHRLLGGRQWQNKVYTDHYQDLREHWENMKICFQSMLVVYVEIVDKVILPAIPLDKNAIVVLQSQVSEDHVQKVANKLSAELNDITAEFAATSTTTDFDNYSLFSTLTTSACICSNVARSTVTTSPCVTDVDEDADRKHTARQLLNKLWGFEDGVIKVIGHAVNFVENFKWCAEVCELARTLSEVVSTVCVPHVMLDARALSNAESDDLGRRLDNQHLIAHFLTVIRALTSAQRIAEQTKFMTSPATFSYTTNIT